MKPERAFVAERIAAQHCPELLRSGPTPSDLVPLLARLGERMARVLANSLAALSGGEAPIVRCQAPRDCSADELAGEIGQLAANSLLGALHHNCTFLASLDAAAVLRLVDRAFGGRGDAPSPLPDAFPLSAELMIARLETIVASASAQALGLGIEGVIALRRDGSLAQLAPFAAAERLAVLTLAIEDGARAPWNVTLAFPFASLADLLGSETPAPRSERNCQPNPTNEPFGEVPLTVSAVLVDMRIGFSTLSALRPGQVLPVAVARSVPLKVGDKTIAHGTIGAMDDRVAVQITQAF